MKDSGPQIIEDVRMITPEDAWAWLWPAAIIVGIVLLTGLVFWRLARRHQLPFQQPPIPPDEVALEKLAAIRPLIAAGRHMEFVIAVSQILREYVQARFELRAPHLSTEEFLYEAERSERLPSDRRAALGAFLAQCDRVKFALAHLLPPGLEELYTTAESFIAQTSGRPAAGAPARP